MFRCRELGSEHPAAIVTHRRFPPGPPRSRLGERELSLAADPGDDSG
jgi:hypothetical protein